MKKLVLLILGAVLALATLYPAALAAQSTPSGVTPQPEGAPASPEALQAARELFALISGGMVSDLTGSMTAQLWPVTESALRRKYPSLSESTVTDLRNTFYRLEQTYIARLMADAPAIYARYFTAEELRAIVAFYRTPAGAKALQVTPRITAEALAAMTPMVPLFQQQATQAFDDILRQRGYPR